MPAISSADGRPSFMSASVFMQVKNINQNVKVTATGKGEAVVKVSENEDAAFTKFLLFIPYALISFFLHARWCLCITLYLKTRTVPILTCQLSFSQVLHSDSLSSVRCFVLVLVALTDLFSSFQKKWMRMRIRFS